MTDSWKHRSNSMKCKTCMWYCPKIKLTPAADKETLQVKHEDIGRCRKHAPTMNGYPVVFVTDWCGDHKLNEEAI